MRARLLASVDLSTTVPLFTWMKDRLSVDGQLACACVRSTRTSRSSAIAPTIKVAFVMKSLVLFVHQGSRAQHGQHRRPAVARVCC
jgi:hypothetical protein